MLNYFLDDSGNTGSNLLDKSQPYFVYGGWLMDDIYKEEIYKYVSTLNFEADELHYKKMSTGLANKAIDLMRKMINDSNNYQQGRNKNLVLPFFIIADKRRTLCEQIQYAIFDSDFGPKELKNFIDIISLHPIFVLRLGKLIKGRFLDDEKLLQKMYNLFATKGDNLDQDLEDCIQALKEIDVDLEFRNFPNFRNQYERFLDCVDRQKVRDDLYSKDDDEQTKAYSSELPSSIIVALFQQLDELGGDINDQIFVYSDGDSKPYMKNHWEEVNEYELDRSDADGNPIMFKNVKRMDYKESSECVGIQLADTLCSSVNESLRIDSGMNTKHYKKNVENESQNKLRDALKTNLELIDMQSSKYQLITRFL